MKYIRALLLAVAALSVSTPVYAASCGFKPFAPFGCRSNNAVCICDQGGNCRWVFVDCR